MSQRHNFKCLRCLLIVLLINYIGATQPPLWLLGHSLRIHTTGHLGQFLLIPRIIVPLNEAYKGFSFALYNLTVHCFKYLIYFNFRPNLSMWFNEVTMEQYIWFNNLEFFYFYFLVTFKKNTENTLLKWIMWKFKISEC